MLFTPCPICRNGKIILLKDMNRDESARCTECGFQCAADLWNRLPRRSTPLISKDDVEWVVNDSSELGVKIGNQFFWLYKGDSLVYESGKHDDGSPMLWRRVGKREFGECCHPVDLTHTPDKYTEGDGWKDLPAQNAVVAPDLQPAPENTELETLRRLHRAAKAFYQEYRKLDTMFDTEVELLRAMIDYENECVKKDGEVKDNDPPQQYPRAWW